jgi:LacI family transcriptional regulator
LRKSGYPIVLLVADPDAGLDVVCIDERLGAFTAVSHLLALGHKRVGILDPAKSLGNSEKADGYARALKKYGLAVDPTLVIDPRGHGPASGYDGMSELMQGRRPPTAVFAGNDRLAIGAIRWCRERGVRVPEDIAIVGFDDNEAASFTDVPLTTMRYEVDDVAYHAVKRLLALIHRSGVAPKPERVLIEPRLVVRQSCGALLRARPGVPRSNRPKLKNTRDGSRARLATAAVATETTRR